MNIDLPIGCTFKTRDVLETYVVRTTVPEGMALVDRARFERLREYVSSRVESDAADAAGTWSHQNATRMRMTREALQPGDLDPLP